MRVAALVPTRDRPGTAHRAAETFLASLSRLHRIDAVTLVLADDSTGIGQTALLRRLAAGLSDRYGNASLEVVRTGVGHEPTVYAPGGGPGAARNAGLRVLRERSPDADVTIMFDDDVAFADVAYRGSTLVCDGSRLLGEALDVCATPRSIAGCGYVGRQDLSILEHASLWSAAGSPDDAIEPAVERANVENVAPGGISTAFLAVAGPPALLPDFPEHYNEDYVWLHAFERAGWSLRRVKTPLIHAPPGFVQITPAGLSFQIRGEIVWLGILERDRYRVGYSDEMAAAVEEIVGDIRTALAAVEGAGHTIIATILREVLLHYEGIRDQFASRRIMPEAEGLMRDIERGLALNV